MAKFSSLWTVFALAAKHNLKLHQMDVKAAYLNANLKEDLYMKAPPGFKIPDGHVLKLKKGVYGTKQGGRIWYEDMWGTLSELGYTRTEADHAIFIHPSDGIPDIIMLYVDDMGLILESLECILQDKEDLRKVYQMTDRSKIGWILGIRITQDREKGTLTLSQEKFIKEILERYRMSNSHPISTPALPNERLVKLTSSEVDAKSYQCTLSSLMYPMLGTRPDLSYAIVALGCHTTNPGPDHQHTLKQVFWYLWTTSNQQLVFERGAPSSSMLFGYADADWASDINDCKSTSGYMFKLAGTTVSWSSKKQMSVALSSTEAEYISGAHTAKEAIWLRQLLSELSLDTLSPTILHVDNQSTIAIAKNPEFHDCTKHIDVRHHFLQQVVEDGTVELHYTPTGDQVTNALTKGLPPTLFSKFRDEMGICCPG
jgi:hypothetical protein